MYFDVSVIHKSYPASIASARRVYKSKTWKTKSCTIGIACVKVKHFGISLCTAGMLNFVLSLRRQAGLNLAGIRQK